MTASVEQLYRVHAAQIFSLCRRITVVFESAGSFAKLYVFFEADSDVICFAGLGLRGRG